MLRAAGSPKGYERLKDFTRGRTIDEGSLAAFIDTLSLTKAEQIRLMGLTPEMYIEVAALFARRI